jgi:hypothetical protein
MGDFMTIRDGFRVCALAGVVVLAAVSLACSFSYSSKSISDSVESSFESSSASSSSSSPESNDARYRDDVESYTQAYVVSGGSEGAFLAGVSEFARKRGITDWESDENTWRGIGRGLGRAKVDRAQLGVYEQNWAGGDPEKVKLIRKGYDEVR